MPVPNSNGTMRICGDYKLTANEATKTEVYPLPQTEELFTTLSGSTSFSELDLSHAYVQLPQAEDSQLYLTVNTHKASVWSCVGCSHISAHYEVTLARNSTSQMYIY